MVIISKQDRNEALIESVSAVRGDDQGWVHIFNAINTLCAARAGYRNKLKAVRLHVAA